MNVFFIIEIIAVLLGFDEIMEQASGIDKRPSSVFLTLIPMNLVTAH